MVKSLCHLRLESGLGLPSLGNKSLMMNKLSRTFNHSLWLEEGEKVEGGEEEVEGEKMKE